MLGSRSAARSSFAAWHIERTSAHDEYKDSDISPGFREWGKECLYPRKPSLVRRQLLEVWAMQEYPMLQGNWNQALQLGNNSLCNIKVLTSKAYSDLLQLEVILSLRLSLSPSCVKGFLNMHSDTVGCCDILYLFNYKSRYSGLEQWWSKHVVSRSGIWHCSSRRCLQLSKMARIPCLFSICYWIPMTSSSTTDYI